MMGPAFDKDGATRVLAGFEHHGDNFLVVTWASDGHNRLRLLRLKAPDPEAWELICILG